MLAKQYTSMEYRSYLAGQGLRPSAAKRGVCFDYAMAESFNDVLENELIYCTEYQTREHARRDVAAYIELFCNCQRLHSGLGYATPLEVYREEQEELALAT